MIPPAADAACTACIDEVLEMNERRWDPAQPMACMDERSPHR